MLQFTNWRTLKFRLGNDNGESISESGLVFLPFDGTEVGGLLKGTGEVGLGIPDEDNVDFIAGISLSDSMLQSVENCCGDLYPNGLLFLTDVKANEPLLFGVQRSGDEIGLSAGAVAIVH